MLRTEEIRKTKFENREKSVNCKLTSQEISILLNQGNDEEDEEQLILRFAPQLRQLMGLPS
jgi:hypothetical protein